MDGQGETGGSWGLGPRGVSQLLVPNIFVSTHRIPLQILQTFPASRKSVLPGFPAYASYGRWVNTVSPCGASKANGAAISFPSQNGYWTSTTLTKTQFPGGFSCAGSFPPFGSLLWRGLSGLPSTKINHLVGLGRLRQEDHELKASLVYFWGEANLGYVVKTCLKKQTPRKEKRTDIAIFPC